MPVLLSTARSVHQGQAVLKEAPISSANLCQDALEISITFTIVSLLSYVHSAKKKLFSLGAWLFRGPVCWYISWHCSWYDGPSRVMERRPDRGVGWLPPRFPIFDARGKRSPGGQGEVGVGRGGELHEEVRPRGRCGGRGLEENRVTPREVARHRS